MRGTHSTSTSQTHTLSWKEEKKTGIEGGTLDSRGTAIGRHSVWLCTQWRLWWWCISAQLGSHSRDSGARASRLPHGCKGQARSSVRKALGPTPNATPHKRHTKPPCTRCYPSPPPPLPPPPTHTTYTTHRASTAQPPSCSESGVPPNKSATLGLGLGGQPCITAANSPGSIHHGVGLRGGHIWLMGQEVMTAGHGHGVRCCAGQGADPCPQDCCSSQGQPLHFLMFGVGGGGSCHQATVMTRRQRNLDRWKG